MMIRYYFFLLLWMGSSSLLACDVCGSAVSSGGVGLLPQTVYNYFGIQWSHATLNASSDADGVVSSAKDHFYRMDLFGRYMINPKWQLTGVLPYQVNSRAGVAASSYKLSGIGDAQIMVSFVPWTTLGKAEASFTFRWEVTAGLKLPTGKYRTTIDEEEIPVNFNIGTGSLDYLLSSNFSINHKAFGLTAQLNYRINTLNKEDYQFGNQLTGTAYLFYNKPLSTTINLLPYAGLAFERIGKDQLEGKYNVADTGGEGWMIATGVDLQMLSWTFRLAFQIPYYQDYANGSVDSQLRYSATVAHLF